MGADQGSAKDDAHEEDCDRQQADEDGLVVDWGVIVPLLVKVLEVGKPLETGAHAPLLDGIARLHGHSIASMISVTSAWPGRGRGDGQQSGELRLARQGDGGGGGGEGIHRRAEV
jgi:hypothetical protein